MSAHRATVTLPPGYLRGLWRYSWRMALLLAACGMLGMLGLFCRCYLLILAGWLIYLIQGTRIGLAFRREFGKKGVA